MLKLRLQRIGRKKRPFYRLVIMVNRTRRDGCPIDYVGYYDPILKQSNFNTEKIVKWGYQSIVYMFCFSYKCIYPWI